MKLKEIKQISEGSGYTQNNYSARIRGTHYRVYITTGQEEYPKYVGDRPTNFKEVSEHRLTTLAKEFAGDLDRTGADDNPDNAHHRGFEYVFSDEDDAMDFAAEVGELKQHFIIPDLRISEVDNLSFEEVRSLT